MIHAEIAAAYDDAERNSEKPPNLRELRAEGFPA
jgi:hypothetical protein